MVETGGHQTQNGREDGELIVNDRESALEGFCGRNLADWQVQIRSQSVVTHWKVNLDNKVRRIALTLDPRLGSVHSISQVILPVLIRGPSLTFSEHHYPNLKPIDSDFV